MYKCVLIHMYIYIYEGQIVKRENSRVRRTVHTQLPDRGVGEMVGWVGGRGIVGGEREAGASCEGERESERAHLEKL